VALADYFAKSALAASQVLEGFDPDLFEGRLASTRIGIAFSRGAWEAQEGRALLDMVIRLTARLYPSIDIWSPDAEETAGRSLSSLARSINPRIELTRSGHADSGIVVGDPLPDFATPIFAGSTGWDAHVSASQPRPSGSSPNPLGAGAAACFAVANLFRRVFLDDWQSHLDEHLDFSTYALNRRATPPSIRNTDWRLGGEAVLAGIGAVGMATIWALARSPMVGVIHLVDAERIELSNLQRYVLATMKDVDHPKVGVAARALHGGLKAKTHPVDWNTFVSGSGYSWPWALAAFDSAEARRELQASLPKWVANAWTQPGDLGISVHPRFGSSDACLACLYLPDAKSPNEDEVVAQALGIPTRVADIRNLLHLGNPVPQALLVEIADALRLDRAAVLAFEGRSIRDLYVQGICGGGLVRMGGLGRPNQAVHVPLAHQSALAGVLLAARLAHEAAGEAHQSTAVARIDLQRRQPEIFQQAAKNRGDRRCICEDADFIARFRDKY
jgi:hypothetical protein